MATVDLTLRLTVPDAYLSSDEVLRDALFSEYVKYINVKRLEEILHWSLAQHKYAAAGDMSMADDTQKLIDHHREWSEVSKKVEIVSVERR